MLCCVDISNFPSYHLIKVSTELTLLPFKNNDTLIDIFDRMINVGTAKNFTEQELQMFDMIEHVTKSAEDLNLEGHHKCYNTFLR